MKNIFIFIFLIAILKLCSSCGPVSKEHGQSQLLTTPSIAGSSSLHLPLSKAEIWFDTIYDWNNRGLPFPHTNIRIEYQDSAQWAHMKNIRPDGTIQYGSFPKINTITASYSFWGFGIEIFTEYATHHTGYIVNLDGIDVDTVITKGPNRFDVKTWYCHKLPYGNHTLQIRSAGTGGGNFVLDKLVTLVDSAPNGMPFYMNGDTIRDPDIHIPGDTIRDPDIHIPGDTIQDPDVHIPGDTIQDPDVHIPGDTIQDPDVHIPGDTICTPCPACPPPIICPDCPDCPPGETHIPIWVWIVMGSLIVTIIALLALKTSKG